MRLDDEICCCYHVSLRKLWNFARRHHPRRASQLSQCLNAGTGCGWCIPVLKKIHRWAGQNQPPEALLPESAEEYAARRESYLREQKTRNKFL